MRYIIKGTVLVADCLPFHYLHPQPHQDLEQQLKKKKETRLSWHSGNTKER